MTSAAPALLARLRAVRALVLDVDGILTDGRLHFTEHGTEHKVFHSRDGHGIKLAQRIGIEVAIISGRASPALHHRAQNLGISHCLTGIARKGEALIELCATLGIPPEHCAVMGDDVIDLPMLQRAGVSATVADAPAVIRHRVDWVTRLPGGQGAVREFIELLIDAQDQWPAILADHDPRDARPIGAA
ncbi:KdsC family phosphatase [Halothiobacillus sp. DCM-1]|uniref:KdsC family phosphatase n=1 Tax=Halothiobacillus sp. DCM-1 TaxID=3112558 RepID=UPI00324FC369